MRIRPYLWLLLAYAAGALAQPPASTVPEPPTDAPVERRIWRGSPIRVALTLGRERSIRIPGSRELRAGLVGGPVPGLRIQSLGERLHLLAREPFETTRLLVQPADGASLLLDLLANGDAPDTDSPLEILTPAGATPATGTASADPVVGMQKDVGYVRLVRHAAQALYAPGRLIPYDAAIARVPVRSIEQDALLRGGRVTARPVAAWRAEGPRGPLWVTAVRLRNRLPAPLDLDPRDVRGRWLACAFQHGHLTPAGDEADTTTAYLISGEPFAEALGAFARTAEKAAGS